MRQKHDRTRSILPKNFYIDNFLNDEHRRYLQYFQANPTTVVDLFMRLIFPQSIIIHEGIIKIIHQGLYL
jgi:hypothetical protein